VGLRFLALPTKNLLNGTSKLYCFSERSIGLLVCIFLDVDLILGYRSAFIGHFYVQKQLLLSAHLSHLNSVSLSVRLSVTRVDQSKAVQATIMKSSPSAWKTLVSGTVKLFHKF